MVQEVQTGIWITNETTLETIEAIGTSSFKIREWRQTTARFVSGCSGSGSVSWYWSSWDDRQSDEILSSDTAITDQNGNQEYSIRDGWIRVPVAWTYQITFTWTGWTSSNYNTLILKWWGKVLYTKEHTSNLTETVTLTVNLGKFDLIEIRSSFYYNGGSSAATLTNTVSSITIQQL